MKKDTMYMIGAVIAGIVFVKISQAKKAPAKSVAVVDNSVRTESKPVFVVPDGGYNPNPSPTGIPSYWWGGKVN